MSKTQDLSVRLHKYIADCGVTSRRKAEGFILDGRVTVNGHTVTELGIKVTANVDTVQVDGNTVELSAVDKVYIVMNKPRAYMTTLSDPEGRPTVMELIYGVKQRIFPVGRLDYLSEGLLILTNDGDLANMIMHPKYEVEKVYEVKVFGHVNEGMLARIRRGVMTEDGLMKPKSVRVIEQLPNKTWIEFRLNEGKNREIRKICDAVDLTVDKLRRVAIEALNIQTLGVGKYMFTTRKELLKALGLNEHGEKISKRSFVSAKKTLNVVKMEKVLRGTSRPADDKRYQAFRKENYYETVAAIKEAKVKEAADKIIEVQETEAQARAADFARKMKHDAPKRTRGYGY